MLTSSFSFSPTVVFSNSLPNDNCLDWFKLKAFTEDKLNVAKMMISCVDRLENTVGNGENAGYQHFAAVPTVFSKAFFFRVVKSGDYVEELKLIRLKPFAQDNFTVGQTVQFVCDRVKNTGGGGGGGKEGKC